MRGLPLNHLLTQTLNARFYTNARLKGHVICGDFIPHLKEYGSGTVKGEVWIVEDKDFDANIHHLDAVESGYKRRRVIVFTENEELECHVYMSQFTFPWHTIIKGGDYKRHLMELIGRRNGM